MNGVGRVSGTGDDINVYIVEVERKVFNKMSFGRKKDHCPGLGPSSLNVLEGGGGHTHKQAYTWCVWMRRRGGR